MKLRSHLFEASLWRAVRQAVRDDPALRGWGRLNWLFRAKVMPRWPGQFITAVWFPLCFWAMVADLKDGHVFKLNPDISSEQVLAFINLWVCLGVAYIVTTLAFGDESTAHRQFFWHLPMSDLQVFVWRLENLVKQLMPSLFQSIFGLALFACAQHLSLSSCLILFLLIPLNRTYTFAWALLLSRRLPSSWMRVEYYLGILIAISLVVAATIRASAPFAGAFNLLLPTAYPLYLIHLWLRDPDWRLVLFLIPIFMVIFTIPDSLRRIRRTMEFTEQVPITPEALEEKTVGDTEFTLDPPILQKGPLERGLWNWLTPQEKRLARFLFPDDLPLTRLWMVTYALATIALPLACLFFRLQAESYLGVTSKILIMLAVGVCFSGLISTAGFALFSGLPSKMMVRTGGTAIHLFAPYPVSFREESMLLIKSILIQIPVFVPLSTIMVAGILGQTCGTVSQGAVKGFELGIAVLAARLFSLGFKWASSVSVVVPWFGSLRGITAYLTLGFLTVLGWIFLNGLMGCLTLFSFAVPFIIWDNELGSIVLCCGMVGLGYLAFRLNGMLYRSRLLDLVQKVSSSSSHRYQKLPWERSTPYS